MFQGMYGVSFEGSQYHMSPLEGFFGEAESDAEYFMVNEASGSSVFAMDDTLAKWNYRLPDWQKWWKPATPYDTFCLLQPDVYMTTVMTPSAMRLLDLNEMLTFLSRGGEIGRGDSCEYTEKGFGHNA
jgi:hypothetical protein